MKCQNCGSDYDGDYRCPRCNKIVATSLDQLKRLDPKSWFIVGLSFAFVGNLGVQ
jgi:DNA-directed RNA polymerase subunit RPC12/RpoP